MELTQEYVQSLFTYEDGKLFWREGPNVYPRKVGKEAAFYSNRINRHLVSVLGKDHSLARLVYIYHHGATKCHVYHRDKDYSNNHIENLITREDLARERKAIVEKNKFDKKQERALQLLQRQEAIKAKKADRDRKKAEKEAKRLDRLKAKGGASTILTALLGDEPKEGRKSGKSVYIEQLAKRLEAEKESARELEWKADLEARRIRLIKEKAEEAAKEQDVLAEKVAQLRFHSEQYGFRKLMKPATIQDEECRGIYFCWDIEKYRVEFLVKGEPMSFGRFDTQEEASEALALAMNDVGLARSVKCGREI